jgi:hypothetical protein
MIKYKLIFISKIILRYEKENIFFNTTEKITYHLEANSLILQEFLKLI